MNNIINIQSPNQDTVIYNGLLFINYSIQNPDINFYAVKFFINNELIETSTDLKKTFSINVNNGINYLTAYCVNKNFKKLPNTDIIFSFESIDSSIVKANEINTLAEYQFPEFIREDYSTFIDFIKEYYKFLEKSNDPNLVPYNLENYRDIDSVPEFILDKIKYEIMHEFGLDISKDIQTGNVANYRNLLKNIKEFYDSKGTENSLKFLFRVLFDKEIEVYYPKLDLFKVSDGKWSEKYYIEIGILNDEDIQNYLNGIIYEENNNVITSQAKIRSIIIKSNSTNTGRIAVLELDEINGAFNGVYPTTKTYVKSYVNGVETIFDVSTITETVKEVLKTTNLTSVKGYISDDGKPSAKKYIQDSYYYQDFSYDLQSDVLIDTFYNTIKTIAHPTGMELFGSALLTKKSISSNKNISTLARINGSIIIANFFGYSFNSKQNLNDISAEIGTYSAYPNGYFFGDDGTALYTKGSVAPTSKPIEVLNAIAYSNNIIYHLSTEELYPIAEEAPPDVPDDTNTINLITSKDSKSSIVDTTIINYLPQTQIPNYKNYWIPANHFKNFVTINAESQENNDISMGEFTIQDVFNSQQSIIL